MIVEWHQIAGLLLLGVGVFWIVRRKVPVGVEGSPPSYFLTGRKAVIAGAVAIAIGIAFLVGLPQ